MSKKDMRNACYKCKWRGEVAGSAHSCCRHPSIEEPSAFLGLAMALSGGHAPQMETKLNVKGDLQGIDGGWFAHPYNFDPVWLISCDGFEPKTKKIKPTSKVRATEGKERKGR